MPSKRRSTTVDLRSVLSSTPVLLACATCLPSPTVDNSGSSTSAGDTTTTTEPADGSTTSVAVPQAPECVAYLDCLAETADAEMLAAAEAMYGAAAPCWADATTAGECATECSALAETACMGGSSSGTGDAPLRCEIETLVPGAPNPIVAGTEVGQLPPDIGDLLARNCGCHYVDPDDLAIDVPKYNGAMQMATWQDFHAPFNGIAVRDRVAERAVAQLSMPPPFYCDALAFGSLSAEDHALLDEWLVAGAPDGASWP